MKDSVGHKIELRYLRDTDGRKVYFVVIRDRTPLFAVECKAGEKALATGIRYFQQRVKVPRFYQGHLGTADFGAANNGGRVLPFSTFCREVG